MTKQCSKCKDTKPLEAFNVDRQAKDGRSYTCKSCRKKAGNAYRKKGGHKTLIDQTDKPWFKCSSCLASIGLGHKKASKILKHVTPGQIYGAWTRGGVAVKKPACGSWRLYASRVSKGRPADRAMSFADIAYEKARMQDIKQACKRGFDWRYEWHKFKASRSSLEKYHSMTQQEKDEHNKRCAKNMKKRLAIDPMAKAKTQEYHKRWRKENRKKCSQYTYKSTKKRKKNDPAFKALCNLRRRFSDIMKSTKNGGTARMSQLIGCTTQELANHLEKQFTEGMSWDNYGFYGWHVDHIKPCASFNHDDEAQVRQCWHYTNLQPLWAEDNLAKSDKW